MGDHRAARALSLLGEHSAIWLAAAAAGAVLDPSRRQSWLGAGRSIVIAHGSSVVLKRVFRVRRPDAELRVVGVPSEWSFPSSHATGSAAAAVALGPLLPRAVLLPLAAGVAWSRVELGVHRRRDVVVGALLGAALSHAGRRRRRGLAQAPSSGSPGRGLPW